MTRRSYNTSGRGALISHRSHIAFLDLIQKNLGKENFESLKSSCFGNLFHIPNLQFQRQLFNVLLRHLDKTSRYRNRLTFCISGRNLEFSPSDFAMITGLKFNNWIDPPVESDIHRIVFRRKTSLTLEDIVVAFKCECSQSSGSSQLSLKLAYLLILFGVLLNVGGKSNNIQITYIHLIDNIEMFNSFPWGQVAYLCLVRRTHRAREVLDNLIKNDKKMAFDANDFVLVLQIWAYEIMPIISRNCATRIAGTDHIFPRFRRWTASHPIKFELLQNYFLKSPAETLRPMIAIGDELEFISSLGVDDIKYGPLANVADTSHIDNITDCNLTPRNTTARVEVSRLVEPINYDILEKRLAELERYMIEMKAATLSPKPEQQGQQLCDPANGIQPKLANPTDGLTLNKAQRKVKYISDPSRRMARCSSVLSSKPHIQNVLRNSTLGCKDTKIDVGAQPRPSIQKKSSNGSTSGPASHSIKHYDPKDILLCNDFKTYKTF